MRNPERIDKFIEKIRALWKTYPNMRFSQLVDSIYSMHTKNHTKKKMIHFMSKMILQKCV